MFTQTEDYIAGIALINAAQGQSLAQLFNTITADINTGLKTLGIATLISLLFAFWFARRVTLSITQPLRQAIYLAQTVAQRDLSLRIQPAGKDEITELEQSLATMNHSLNAAISEVYAGIEAIATATTQINSGNLDLSARTEQQAGALTETASTIEEFTTTVRQNADHALQANELAQTATQTANNGGQMVQNLIGTMTEIHTKTEQIGDATRQNAALAEQTATAGDSLHEQAQNLTRLVSSFKLQENTLDQADYAPAFAINTGTGRRLEMG